MTADDIRLVERVGAGRPDMFEGVAEEPGSAKHDPVLVVDGLKRRFGGLVAVDVQHLEIQRGAITALIGPNGAGKTTFFNLLTRFDTPTSGTTRLNGVDVSRKSPHRLARLGMVRTFQLTRSLTRMTVIDNMKLGAGNQRGENILAGLLQIPWRAQEAEIEARADELLSRFNLTRVRDDFAGELSGGQRKLLEMARALMAEPSVVMLDEPMAGVNPALTQSLLDHVKQLRDEGRTVIFVEHDMDVVYDISDWVVVMAEGAVIAEGRPHNIGHNQEVIDAYLGSHHDGPLELEDDPAGAGPEERS